MNQGYEVIENFSDDAEALRAGFEAHFANPDKHRPDQHQVWNYWYVPGNYAYLRTDPAKIVGPDLAQRFYENLKAFAFERWGFGYVYTPYMSCYVAGCHQVLHNDAQGGRIGYVYSLTRWEERRFSGGETLIFREDPYFGSEAMLKSAAATGFYNLIPARFNQLLVFDDRLPHAVPRIEGDMNPVAGRVVMHGHFTEGAPVVEGPLGLEDVRSDMERLVIALMRGVMALGRSVFHGLLILRCQISPDGLVTDAVVTFNRVLAAKAGWTGGPFDEQAALKLLADVRFPAASEPSRITIPIALQPG